VANAAVGARLVYSVVAYDVHGAELLVGPDASVAWTFSGVISERRRPGCGDILPICPAASDGYASANTPGIGTATATFGAVHATATTRAPTGSTYGNGVPGTCPEGEALAAFLSARVP